MLVACKSQSAALNMRNQPFIQEQQIVREVLALTQTTATGTNSNAGNTRWHAYRK
jgi:hypothetical protein